MGRKFLTYAYSFALLVILGTHFAQARPTQKDEDIESVNISQLEHEQNPSKSEDGQQEEEQEKEMDLQSGFIASFSMILVSEIADKTFFIAAILSGTFNKWIVFAGSFGSLVVQTVLSVAVGRVLLTFLRIEIAELISNVLFLVFGFLSLKDGIQMKKDDSTEMQEVEDEIQMKNLGGGAVGGEQNSLARDRSATTSSKSSKISKSAKTILNKVFIQAFTMTFLAEWGDRSQIATINLAATHNAIAVCVGGILGHMICTGIACLGGSLFARKINPKTITIVGAMFFLGFGVYGLGSMYYSGEFEELF